MSTPGTPGRRIAIGGVDATESSTDDGTPAPAGLLARLSAPLQTRQEVQQAVDLYKKHCKKLAGVEVLCGYRVEGQPPCSNQPFVDGRFCKEHTCPVDRCACPKVPGKPHCEEHTCKAVDCENMYRRVQLGQEFCEDCSRRVRCFGLCKPRRTPQTQRARARQHPRNAGPPRTVDNPAFAAPVRRAEEAIKNHPRVGTKFVCLVPGHARHGTIGTIHHVFEDDLPPLPSRLVAGVAWDDASAGDSGGTGTVSGSGGLRVDLEEVTLEDGNHLATPSCGGYKEGDAVAVANVGVDGGGATRTGAMDVTVVAQLQHSRYRLKQNGVENSDFELVLNAANSYRPYLSQEVSIHVFRTHATANPSSYCYWAVGMLLGLEKTHARHARGCMWAVAVRVRRG